MGIGRRLRMGMVGGGPGSFIGEVHRKAARMDGGIELVAGAFSRDGAKSRVTGQEQYLDPKRVYGSWEDMVEGENKHVPGERIDFVSIVTPNDAHFPVAKGFLEAGFDVICDKPMTLSLVEAKELARIVQKTGRIFGLTHNYTGYPMVKLARDMVRQGDLGKVHKIVVRYPQGWLMEPIEREGSKQAEWRTDPARSGAAGCMGDIGTHAANLAEYISGLKITEVCVELTTFVPGRRLDDDGNCLLRYDNGAKGLLWASQVSTGEENNLTIWVYGDKRSIEWHQEHPDELYVKQAKGPVEVWRRGNPYVGEKSAAAGRATRLPFGHPEAFIEAFANIYVNYADALRARIEGRAADETVMDFPGVAEGVRGMAFIETVVKSGKSSDKWVKMVE